MSQAVEMSFGARLTMLGREQPDRTAVVVGHADGTKQALTFGALDRDTNRAARLLASVGVSSRSRVALAVPNGIAWFVACFAIWKLGACVFTVRSDLPAWEASRLFDAADPSHCIGEMERDGLVAIAPARLSELDRFDAAPLPDRIADPYKVNATGGSTGVPKIVIPEKPGVVALDDTPEARLLREKLGQVQIVVGPLYHYGPSFNAVNGLMAGRTIVTFERFDPAQVMQAIETHRVQTGMLVPTMLYRILQLPDVARYDTGSLIRLGIAGAKCPDWVFEQAIGIFGADVLGVGYGGTENVGMTAATGREWLAHRGTAGRPNQSEFIILDAQGEKLPAGEIGEIWMRPLAGVSTRYLNAEMPMREGGFTTLGDIGWLDDDGYLYIADRRKDLIVSGGANVYPAEVEAALLQHPGVADAAVVGKEDPEWGATVHAVLVAAACPCEYREIKAFCAQLLAPYKVPRSIEWREILPRDDLGKLRRSAL